MMECKKTFVKVQEETTNIIFLVIVICNKVTLTLIKNSTLVMGVYIVSSSKD